MICVATRCRSFVGLLDRLQTGIVTFLDTFGLYILPSITAASKDWLELR